MKKLSENLLKLANGVDLFKEFIWPVPIPCPIEIPPTLTNEFEKNVYLKKNYKNKPGGMNLDDYYWLINIWGGIGSFKRNDQNTEKLETFVGKILQGKEALSKKEFVTISSLSKIASFLMPEKYVIYDSRTIYALNWVIYISDEVPKLFPQPNGRNADIKGLEQETLFRLSNKPYSYINEKDAFHLYCKKIVEISRDVFQEKPIYETEMILFILSTGRILDHMKRSIEVKIRA